MTLGGVVRLRRLICGFAGLALVLPLMGQDAGAADAGPAWLDRVNTIRVASGLAPVTSNDAWNAGIVNHLNYLDHELGTGTMTGAYASSHTENPGSRYYTADGARGARSSVLAYGTRSDVGAVNEWFTAPLHAIGLLRPGLAQVAFARAASGNAGLDVISGFTGSPGVTSPIVFPGAGSTTGLVEFGGESPDPTETCQHIGKAQGFSGLPIIAMLPQTPAESLTATLQRPDGSIVSSRGPDLCLVTEFNYFSSNPVYGPSGLSTLQYDRAVLVIPRQRLTRGTYRVALTAPGMADVAWSFQAAPPPAARRAATPKNVKRPSITGRAKVRRTLKAHVGRWSTGGIDVSYQWIRDDKRIRGATRSTYRVKRSDRRHKIRVRIITAHANSRDGHALSKWTKVVK